MSLQSDIIAQTCQLYPIALSATQVSNAAPGTVFNDALNGTRPGNFGWLSWAGSPSEPTLVKSLTAPGDSSTYVNPDHPADHQINLGDWIQSKPGVSNSKKVRDALDGLKGVEIVVPVWDQARGQGANAAYRVSSYARIRIVGYQLPQQNRITVEFLGYASCDAQNLPPTVDAGPDQTISITNTATLNGTVTDDGLPVGGTLTVSWSAVIGPGEVTFGDPHSAATTAQFSNPGIYVLTLTASDSDLVGSDDVVITVNRENDPPVPNPPVVETDEDTPVAVTLAGSDPDGDALSYAVTVVPNHGQLSGTPPQLLYTPDADYNGLDSFEFKVNDGQLDSSNALVNITVRPVNDPPVADPITVTNLEDRSFAIVLSGSDVEGDALTFRIVTGPTNGTLTLDPSGATNNSGYTYTPNSNYFGTDEIIYTSNDGSTDSAPATVSIVILPVDDTPLVDAGPDQLIVAPTNTVALAGMVVYDDFPGSVQTVEWTKLGGPGTVAFGDASNEVTTATFSESGIYELRLTASDSFLSATDDLAVTFDAPPAVDAGPDQTNTLPAQVALDGTVSDDGILSNAVHVSWSKVSGPGPVIFSNPNHTNTTASFSESGVYGLRLTADDGIASTSDDVTVLVNRAPLVDAGSDQIITGLETTLNGSVIDDSLPRGAVLSTWTQASGPGTVLFSESTTTNLQPTTVAAFSQTGVYVLRLSADDSLAVSSNEVTITVDAAPQVNAGPDLRVTVGDDVALAGAVTDDGLPVGAAVTTRWTLSSGVGLFELADASNASTMAIFHEIGTYVLRLMADDSVATNFDEVTITVLPINRAPAVTTGPRQLVMYPSPATLSGAVTDDGLPENAPVVVTWTKVSGPGDVTFADATLTNTTATFGAPGDYVLRLQASDTALSSFADLRVAVRTPAMNEPPMVRAGANQVVGLTNVATLGGSVTDDGLPQGAPLTADWSLVSGPGTVTFSQPSTTNVQPVTSAAFTAVGTYVLRLTASDSELSASSDVTITVYPYNQPPFVDAGPDQTITIPDPAVLMASGVTPTNANNELSVSLSEVPHWDNSLGQPGITGAAWGPGATWVYRHGLDVDHGTLVVAGAFTNAGGIWAKSLARYDGTNWYNFYDTNIITETCGHAGCSGNIVGWLILDCNGFPFCNEIFYCAAIRNQEVFAGGQFKDLGNLDGFTDATARWDGERWHSWVCKSAGQGVQTIETTADKVYVGGNFAFQPTNATAATLTNLPWSYNIATWDGTNWGMLGEGIRDIRNTVNPTGPDVNVYAYVTSIAVATNGNVYVAGDFLMQTASGIASNIAMWNGTEWETLGSGLQATHAGGVHMTGMALGENGDLYVGGLFNNAGSVSVRNIARWDGTRWWPLGEGPNNGVLGQVEAVLAHGRDVYVGGSFADAGGQTAWRVARWDGQLWLPLGSGTSVSNGIYGGSVLSLAADDSGVYVGGQFQTAGGLPANNLAQWVFPKQPPRGALLHGLVTDDGLPTDAPLTATWTKVSGPGEVTFADLHSPITTAIFSKAGQYLLRLTASDTDLTGLDEVTIDVRANEAPVVNAGPDYMIGLNEPLAINASISDDGLPQGAPIYHVWSKLYGPGEVTFDHRDQTNVIARFSQQGTYVLRLYANDSQFTASDDLTVVVKSPANVAPSVYPGSSATIPLGGTRQMNAFVSDNDGMPAGILRCSWNVLSGPGAVTFDDATRTNAIVSFSTNGTYVLQLTANDSELSASANVTITVLATTGNPPTVNAGPDQTVSNLVTTLQGSVSDDGLPMASALNVYWSATASSGVTFANSNSLGTTVTFPKPGQYTLTLTANDGIYGRSDTVVITVAARTPLVDAGPDRTIRLPTNQLQLTGLALDSWSTSRSWTRVSGPTGGNVTFSPSSAAMTNTATFTTNGTYVLRLTVYENNTTYSDDLTVTVVPATNQQPPAVDAGPDRELTWFSESDTLTLNGSITDDGLPSGTLSSQWTKVAGPGAVTFSQSSHPVTSVLFDQLGVYILRLTGTDGALTNADDVIVSVKPPENHGPVANAGPDLSIRYTNIVVLNGVISDDALPAAGPLTAFWRKVSGPGMVAFGSPATNSAAASNLVATTTATFGLPGTYVLRLFADDSGLAVSDDVTIEALPADDNQPPVVNAGADTAVVAFGLLPLNGSVTDDGLPEGAPLAVNWSVVSSPSFSKVFFSDANILTPYAQFSTTGTYVLRLVCTDGRRTGSDDVTVAVTAPTNEPPLVFAGLPIEVTRPNPAYLDGVVLDDGLPLGYPLLATWSKISGPGSVTFQPTPDDPLADAYFSAPGNYVLRLTVNDSQFVAYDEIDVTVYPGTNAPPYVNAGPDITAVLSEPTPLHTEVLDDGLDAGVLQVSWSQLSGPGVVLFSTVNGVYRATFVEPGDYTLRLTANDGSLTNSDDVGVTVYDADAPVAEIQAPADGAIITSPTNLIGTASSAILQSYLVEYRLKPAEPESSSSSSSSSNWTVLASYTVSVVSNTLAAFDPTLLLNGIYQLRLTVTDQIGRSAVTEPVTVVVDRNLKIGQFTISFNDLALPVPGLPLQVTRTYDSRAAAAGIQGDFGIGWTLDIRNVRLQKNRPLSRNWTEYTTGSPWDLSLVYHLDPGSPRLVSITFPDGRVEKFQLTPFPMDQPLIPINYPQWLFTPLGNTRGTLLPAGYDEPDGRFLYFGDAIPGAGNLYDLNFFFDTIGSMTGSATPQEELERYPTLFRYTSPEGFKYLIDEVGGLQSVTDPNGNTLLVSTNGLTWTNLTQNSELGPQTSLSIAFQRDPLGRITNIVDAAGNSMSYTYSTNGNLVGFTDRAGQTNGFVYDNAAFPHYLTGIVDARGVTPVQNVYDADGRLVGNIDAFGAAITYGHDTANNREYITNRLGQVTISEYDDHGNVVHTIDPLGAETFSSYDENGNVVATVDALGRTNSFTYDEQDNRLTATDPLGNTTYFTYSDLRRVTSVTDPRGNSITNTFDSQGNLLAMRDPIGNVTRFAYNNQGLPTFMTNAAGQVMQFVYDPAGRLSAEVDALGHETDYQRDPNGNLLQQTTTRTTPNGVETLAVHFEYDTAGRLTNSIFPDGSSAQTIYNTIGKAGAAIDQLGRQTTMEYDELGQLTRTIYTDGTSEGTAYDAEGRRVASTNRIGQVTQFEYDAGGRLFRTIYRDGTSTTNYFDLAGQIIVSTDMRGNSTFYGYDAAGRSVAVTNALGEVTFSSYDNSGNLTNAVDALGRSTTFIYDQLNRRVQTMFADGTTQRTFYDALGRRIAETDQATNTTWFGYDTLGRLTSVTNALGYVTTYAYDELGQQLSQTDANNHTTTFEYDSLGRRVKRTLPGNQVETYAYNIGGLLTNKTDFNGYTTTYQYDLMNRLLARIPDARRGEASVAFAYNTLGLRTNMTDAAGSTSYQYDDRNRLSQKTRSWGAALTVSLNYLYDESGNLTNIVSSDPNGVNVSYEYDALDRLNAVDDVHAGRTLYAYDQVGNLARSLYPNFVESVWQYDSLNRLTNLSSGQLGVSIATYAYTVGASGNRLTAAETLPGSVLNAQPKTINRVYTYDNIYRLTGESITLNSQQSTLNYSYDPVGNRLSRSSTLSSLLPQSFTFDANDRLTTDQYDANGNTIVGHVTTAAPPVSDTYDFENRLVYRTNPDGSTISIGYDGDGNRVSKTVTTATNTATTFYVVDDQNPTGYAQVLEELVSRDAAPVTLDRVYTYGSTLISQTIEPSTFNLQPSTRYYGYDGHNNVRYLTDENGTVTDTYDYDAFGNLIARTGVTPNNYLFTGEQYDSDLGLYHLRARYHNPDTGRFWTQDSFEGFGEDPTSLHRYTYCANNPVNAFDPSGNITLNEVMESTLIRCTIKFALWGAVFGVTEAALTGGDMAQGAINGAFFGAITGASFGLLGGPAAMANLPVNYWTTKSGLTLLAVMTAIGSYSVSEALNQGQYALAAWRFGWTVLPLYGAGRASTVQEVTVYAENSYTRARRSTLFPVTGTPEPINPPRLTRPYQVVANKLSGKYTYTAMPGGELRLGKMGLTDFPNKHMDLSGGRPVLAAGTVEFSQGRVVLITDDSGHYNQFLTPLQRVIQRIQALAAFRESGLPVSDGQYQGIR